MDTKFWVVVAVQIVGFVLVCVKLYAKSYSTEKGKNLATKEDIGEITQIVEGVKISLLLKTEELKSELSYKNEHLIHLRASERAAIINYYKATWVLILNFTRADITKYEIDNFRDKSDEMSDEPDEMSDSQYVRYVAEAEVALNKIKEELANLKYLKEISEAELMFFYDKPELSSLIKDLNSSLSTFERTLIHSINHLLQVFKEAGVKLNSGQTVRDTVVDVKRKRSDILANWYENRYNSFALIRTFNDNLKHTLLERLTSLTT